jgi:hypothetical protein
MQTIQVKTQPTAERNVSLVVARLSNFDFMGPTRGPHLLAEQYNPNGQLFDSANVMIDGEDWQNWPCDLTEEQDLEYLGSVITRKLGLTKRLEFPFFKTFPNPLSLIEGDSGEFSVSVGGFPDDFTYQWKKDGQNIVGATGDSYQVGPVVADQNENYSVIVSNSQGSITGSASLSVINFSAPNIIVNLIDKEFELGSQGQIFVTAEGVPVPSFQWSKNGEEVVGATGSSFFFSDFQSNNTGTYKVEVFNNIGSIDSNESTVTISQ